MSVHVQELYLNLKGQCVVNKEVEVALAEIQMEEEDNDFYLEEEKLITQEEKLNSLT